MKKNVLLFISVLCILLSGCVKDIPINDLSPSTQGGILLTTSGDNSKEDSTSTGQHPSGRPVASDGYDFLWFNETTKELRFKDNFSMKDVLADCETLNFYLEDEYLFAATIYMAATSPSVINSLVLYYNVHENRFFLLDGYPDASVIGFYSYQTAPDVWIEVVGNAEAIQALRNENMQRIAAEWNKFIAQLKKDGKHRN